MAHVHLKLIGAGAINLRYTGTTAHCVVDRSFELPSGRNLQRDPNRKLRWIWIRFADIPFPCKLIRRRIHGRQGAP